VQALAWSSDGKLLAAGGGEPGIGGEITLFDTSQGTLLRKLSGHTEVVTSVSWRPNAPEIATGSLDKTIRIWNTESGANTHTLKDHADTLACVTYSADGTLLASASADRTAKVFDTGTWKRLYTLNAHPEPLTFIAFHPNGKLLATASTDKTIRLWTLKSGGMENPDRTLYEGDIINACRFSPNGDYFIYGAANRKVKLYNGDGTQQKRDQQEAEDWVYAVAIAPDSQTFVAGTQDGKLLFWSMNEGKLLRTVAFSPPPAKRGTAK
jgi:WD40 repeat protein